MRTCTTATAPAPAQTTPPAGGPARRAACRTSDLSVTVPAAAAHLRALTSSNGKVGVIGTAPAARQSFSGRLAACRWTPPSTATARFVNRRPAEGMPLKVGPSSTDQDLSCPPARPVRRGRSVIPHPIRVNELEEELKAQGKTYEFHIYDGAGHAFFSVNRTAYRPEAAVDGWEKILTWFGRYLTS